MLATDSTPYLPVLYGVNLGLLVLACSMCFIIEVVAAVLVWRVARVTQQEAAMLHQRQTLKAGVAKTNFTSTFVENAKLKRLLLKVEKDVEHFQAEKEKRTRSITRFTHTMMVVVYSVLIISMWGRPLLNLSPEYLWPSTRVHALTTGGEAGCMGALSIVIMSRFGIASRFTPV